MKEINRQLWLCLHILVDEFSAAIPYQIYRSFNHPLVEVQIVAAIHIGKHNV